MKLQPAQIEMIAHICHEANRAYCKTLGDATQKPWELAEAWQRDSSVNGVIKVMEGEVENPGDSHRSWLEEKRIMGWRYGREKSSQAKTHPDMVDFQDLPRSEQLKDHLFVGVAKALIGGLSQ